MSPSAQHLLSLLPQTQCQRCGYPDCAAYAQAMAQDQAPINQCPPGGDEGIQRLAQATGRPVIALNPEFGQAQERTLAFIDEDWCIGCTLCIKACPVDAIVGTSKHMHTIIEAHCTGCELCIPACPVDCIEIEIATPGRQGWQAWSQENADQARNRYEKKSKRCAIDKEEKPKMLEKVLADKLQALQDHPHTVTRSINSVALQEKQKIVQAALAKAQAQIQASKT